MRTIGVCQVSGCRRGVWRDRGRCRRLRYRRRDRRRNRRPCPRRHLGAQSSVRRKYAVADAAVIVPALIEPRTEALQEAHRAQPRMRRCRGAAAQFTLDAADEDTQHPRRQRSVVT